MLMCINFSCYCICQWKATEHRRAVSELKPPQVRIHLNRSSVPSPAISQSHTPLALSQGFPAQFSMQSNAVATSPPVRSPDVHVPVSPAFVRYTPVPVVLDQRVSERSSNTESVENNEYGDVSDDDYEVSNDLDPNATYKNIASSSGRAPYESSIIFRSS